MFTTSIMHTTTKFQLGASSSVADENDHIIITYGDFFKGVASCLSDFIVTSLSTKKRSHIQDYTANAALRVSSMFDHYYNGYYSIWASPFMSYFAGYINQRKDCIISDTLRKVLYSSNIDGVHEYLAYRTIYETFSKPDGFFWITSVGDGCSSYCEKWTVEEPWHTTRLIRSISDLSSLNKGEIGKRSVPNNMMMDLAERGSRSASPNQQTSACVAIVQSLRIIHRESFEAIRQALDVNELKVIFVLQDNHFDAFQPLTNLPPFVKQFKMKLVQGSSRSEKAFSLNELQNLAKIHRIDHTGKKHDLYMRLKHEKVV